MKINLLSEFFKNKGEFCNGVAGFIEVLIRRLYVKLIQKSII